MRHRIRDLALVFAAATLIAAPWYVLVTLRNGAPFLEEFFWKHHFGRFLSSALQHGQPFWFYVPVLLAGLFPWTPLLALLFSARLFQDRRAQFLLAWFAWGFLFFSVSRNKLPGYLLPLLAAAGRADGDRAAEAARAARNCGVWPLARFCFVSCRRLRKRCPKCCWTASLTCPSARHLLDYSRGSAWRWPAPVGEDRERAISPWRCVATLTVIAVGTMVWRVYPELDRQLSGRAAGINDLPAANESFPALQHRLLCRPKPSRL